MAVSAGTGTENKRGIVDAVYESRALLADHKAPADETMKSNLGMWGAQGACELVPPGRGWWPFGRLRTQQTNIRFCRKVPTQRQRLFS